ncbi:MAG TPA: response regulator [Magnetospirillaceae bacterium]|jgi:DNA-binding response OmpR family regulator
MAHILVIDDEPGVRSMIRDTLEPEHTIAEAADGIEGMQKFATETFDLVIVDIIMPEQEGLETLLQIHRLRADQKIIAISGGGRTGTIEFLRLAENIGVTKTLKKPFSPAVLRDAVRFCLRSD